MRLLLLALLLTPAVLAFQSVRFGALQRLDPDLYLDAEVVDVDGDGDGDDAAPAADPLLPSVSIVNGVESTPNSIPFQVSLQVSSGGGWFHFCGGSIYNEKTIITAGHCIGYAGPTTSSSCPWGGGG